MAFEGVWSVETDGMTERSSGDAAPVEQRHSPALRALHVVGRPDPAFDRLTRLATLSIHAPIALITVLDENRQVFASDVGLPEPWGSVGETPLSHSFCQHVIETGESLIIDDARQHPLVRDNLAIRDLGVVAYLGVPLVAASGHVLGTFCVIDSVPRVWTTDEIEMVESLAESAMTEVNRRAVVAEREAILDRITDAVFALDRDWRFTYLNPKCADIFERSHDELLGNVIWDEFPDVADSDIRDEYERAVRDNVTVSFEVYYPPSSAWFEVRAYPSPEGLSVYFRNITDERESNRRIAFQARLLDSVGDAVIATTLDGTIIYWNRAAEHLYGWPREEVLGRNVVETTVPETSRHLGDDLFAILASGETWSGEFDVQHRDGTVFPVVATNAPVHDEDGQQIGIVSVSADIRERRRMEAALQAHVKGREEFLSMAAHELKTPLTTIKGMTQLIERRARRGDDLRDLPSRLDGQVDRMQMLVSDLLDVSRLQSGVIPPRPERMNLAALVREVTERFEFSPERNAGHHLVIDAPEEVVGKWDRSRLDQVVTNLLSNAFKYSPEGGDVRVSVRDEGDVAIVSVSDQGIGIDSRLQETIFEPFVRQDRVHRDVTGTGLGLHITKRIVERHGGTISVESEPGQGATFTVQLPRTTSSSS